MDFFLLLFFTKFSEILKLIFTNFCFIGKKFNFPNFLSIFSEKFETKRKHEKKLVSERCFWVFYCPQKPKKYWKNWKWKKKITNFEGFFEPFQCFYCILSNNGEEIYQWDLANFDCVLIDLTKFMNRHWFMVMFHLNFNLYGCFCD